MIELSIFFFFIIHSLEILVSPNIYPDTRQAHCSLLLDVSKSEVFSDEIFFTEKFDREKKFVMILFLIIMIIYGRKSYGSNLSIFCFIAHLRKYSLLFFIFRATTLVTCSPILIFCAPWRYSIICELDRGSRYVKTNIYRHKLFHFRE